MLKNSMAKSGPKPKTLDVARVESVAAMGGTNEQIASALGVSQGTLFNIRKRDKAVDEAITRGKDKADLRVVAALYQKALTGDVGACCFWLKNRRPNEWRDRWDHTVTGKEGESLINWAELVRELDKTKT